MIRAEKHDRALEAINIILVYARAMAAERAAYEDLVAVLDVAEYLPMLFLQTADTTDHFRDMLSDTKHPAFQAALERFDRP